MRLLFLRKGAQPMAKAPQVIFESPVASTNVLRTGAYRTVDLATYRSDTTQARFLTAALALLLAALVTQSGWTWLLWRAMENQPFINTSPAVSAKVQQLAIAGLWLTLFRVLCEFSAFATFLVWQYRVHQNLIGLGHRKLRFTPKMGLVWWFIPVMNFLYPAIVVNQIASRSSCREDFTPRRTGWLVAVWWAVCLALTFGGLYVSGYTQVPTRWEELKELLFMNLLCYACEALLASLTFALMWTIRHDQRRQKRAIEEVM